MLFTGGKEKHAEATPHLEHGPSFKKRLGWWIKSGREETITLDVTPEMAAEMLEYNDRNRPLRMSRQKLYAERMKAGRWKFNGDTVTFSGERLIDGQKRLGAIVDSGVTVRLLLVFGVADDSFATKDIGETRTAANIFAIHNVPNAAMMASATNIVMNYDAGTARTGINGLKPDHETLYAEYEKHPDLQCSASIGHSFITNKGIAAPSLMAALHYICARRNRALADTFFRRLADGADMKRSEPVYKLRKRLVEANASSTTKLSRVAIAALTIKAWNATRDGNSNVLLRWNEDESFPRAH